MKIKGLLHDCAVPDIHRPAGIVSLTTKWRCPECGQRWKGENYGSTVWERRGKPSIMWEARQRAKANR